MAAIGSDSEHVQNDQPQRRSQTTYRNMTTYQISRKGGCSPCSLPCRVGNPRVIGERETQGADAVLSGVYDQPVRFAARLAAADVRRAGGATRHTRKALRAGVAWWRAGAPNSAGAAAAARSSVFGLLWSDDPAQAAWEAAVSATVTHGPSGGDRRRHRACRDREGPARQAVAGRCGRHLRRIPAGLHLRRHLVLMADIQQFDSRCLSCQALKGQLHIGETLELNLKSQAPFNTCVPLGI